MPSLTALRAGAPLALGMYALCALAGCSSPLDETDLDVLSEPPLPGEPDDTYLMLNIDLYDLVQKKRAELPEFKQWARAQARELVTSAAGR